MDISKLKETPHRRFNPLLREWVLVSPHRTQRPWQGQKEKSETQELPAFDPTCYLCPGNVRAGGARNPEYPSTFVFQNDFAALKPDIEQAELDEQQKGLLIAKTEGGLCKVVCFSPRHDLTLARMDLPAIRRVVDIWAEQYAEIGASPEINYVEIFENRGAMMGCSNPHPHGQIWANQSVPNDPAEEQASLVEYAKVHGKCMLCEYVALERSLGSRIVVENQDFVVVVPFWATWPFETMLLSKRHVADLTVLTTSERDSLADIFKRTTTRYDNLFEVSFPYSMGFHQKPTDEQMHPEWHLHAHFFPPLLRSATVRKFMVGYELLASPQRDITPEIAAERLRSLSERHYAQSESPSR